MEKIRVFSDYLCPYCKSGYETLLKLLPDYPGAKIEWIPVESHPRPENYQPHTDLCIQSYYIAMELNADLASFHSRMFHAVVVERKNVEKPEVLANIAGAIMDKSTFLEILISGKYREKVTENNDLAFEKEGVWFVPAFRAGKFKLDAKGDIGVSREDLKNFLDKISYREQTLIT